MKFIKMTLYWSERSKEIQTITRTTNTHNFLNGDLFRWITGCGLSWQSNNDYFPLQMLRIQQLLRHPTFCLSPVLWPGWYPLLLALSRKPPMMTAFAYHPSWLLLMWLSDPPHLSIITNHYILIYLYRISDESGREPCLSF